MFALLTMVVGNVVALSQTNVKRMLAYSSIAQAGYMLVGLVSLGKGQLAGIDPVGSLLLYVLAYLFTNLGAFAVIIAVDNATGSSELTAFTGLMRRSPLLAVTLFIFFLSLVGIPPLAGFLGKFAVFSSAIAAGEGTLAVIGVLTGVVAVGYYFKVIREMFFVDAPADAAPIRPAQGLTFVIAVCLVMTFVVGVATSRPVHPHRQRGGRRHQPGDAAGHRRRERRGAVDCSGGRCRWGWGEGLTLGRNGGQECLTRRREGRQRGVGGSGMVAQLTYRMIA